MAAVITRGKIDSTEVACLPYEHYSCGYSTTRVQLLQVKWYVANTFCRLVQHFCIFDIAS